MCHYVPYVSLGTTALSESTYLSFPHGSPWSFAIQGQKLPNPPPHRTPKKNHGMGSCNSLSQTSSVSCRVQVDLVRHRYLNSPNNSSLVPWHYLPLARELEEHARVWE